MLKIVYDGAEPARYFILVEQAAQRTAATHPLVGHHLLYSAPIKPNIILHQPPFSSDAHYPPWTRNSTRLRRYGSLILGSRSRAHVMAERARDVPRARAGFGTPGVLASLSSVTRIPFQAKVQSSVHQLTGICWKKCVASSHPTAVCVLSPPSRCVTGTPGKYFSSGEQSCLANCVDRFLDSSLFLVKQIEQKREGGF